MEGLMRLERPAEAVRIGIESADKAKAQNGDNRPPLTDKLVDEWLKPVIADPTAKERELFLFWYGLRTGERRHAEAVRVGIESADKVAAQGGITATPDTLVNEWLKPVIPDPVPNERQLFLFWFAIRLSEVSRRV